MTIHSSHDFPPPDSPRWRCRNCDCLPNSLDAQGPCTSRPVQIYTDDPNATEAAIPGGISDSI